MSKVTVVPCEGKKVVVDSTGGVRVERGRLTVSVQGDSGIVIVELEGARDKIVVLDLSYKFGHKSELRVARDNDKFSEQLHMVGVRKTRKYKDGRAHPSKS